AAKCRSRGDHDGVECRGTVEQAVLVVFFGWVGIVTRSLDNGDDMPLEIDEVTAESGHRSADTVDCYAEQPPVVQVAEAQGELFAREAGVEKHPLTRDAERVGQIT